MSRDRARLATRSLAQPVALAVFLAAALALSAGNARSQSAIPQFEGEAITTLIDYVRGQGFKVVFSSKLVSDDMRVESRLQSKSPVDLLREALAPHGLSLRSGPQETLIIVRSPVASSSISGTVVDQETFEPLPGARVWLETPNRSTTSNAAGAFTFENVPDGRYRIYAESSGYDRGVISDVTVPGDSSDDLTFYLQPDVEKLSEIVVTASTYSLYSQGRAFDKSFDREAIDKLPHLGDDPFRAMQWSPGTTSGGISAQFHPRGGELNETQIFLDGLELFNAFHLNGFQTAFSVVDSNIVEDIQYNNGGFSARYGGRMSGVVNIESRELSGERRNQVGISSINAYAQSEGPINGEKGQWFVSARRGYLDLVLNFVDPESEFDPVYSDVLGKVQYRISDSMTLVGNVLLVYDDIRLDDPPDEVVGSDFSNENFWINARNEWSPALYSETIFSHGTGDMDRRGFVSDTDFASAVADSRDYRYWGIRQDWEFDVSDRVFLRWGGQGRRLEADYDYVGQSTISDPLLVGSGPPVQTTRVLSSSPSGSDFNLYFSSRFRVSDPLTVEVGLRWDKQTYTSIGGADQLSPRLNLLYAASENTHFRAAWGRYYQPQGIHELQVEDGIADFFRPQKAEHLVVSMSRRLGEASDLRIEAYWKKLTDLRPRFENLFNPIELIPEAEPDRIRIDAESGQARGIEFTFARRASDNFNWWVSYTYSRIEDRIDGRDVLRSWDQAHALTASANWQPGKWNLNLSTLFHTGWPTTDVTAEFDAGGPVTIIPALGPRNELRYDDYLRIDFRASRSIEVRKGELTFYLELTNALNRDNPCCVDDFEFRSNSGTAVNVRRVEGYWLPVIPSLGINWEFP